MCVKQYARDIALYISRVLFIYVLKSIVAITPEYAKQGNTGNKRDDDADCADDEAPYDSGSDKVCQRNIILRTADRNNDHIHQIENRNEH